jgi:hypothetical protein
MTTDPIHQNATRPLTAVFPATPGAGANKQVSVKSHWLKPLAILCCLLPATVQALDFTYTDNGTTITITGYTGSGGAVDIPASIVIDTVSKPVTILGDAAFSGLTSVTSVTIPDSVISIGVGTFAACGNLTAVAIGSSVTSIGDGAFNACGKLASVTIPNSVTSIGLSAFFNCASLTSVVIGNGVTSIGQRTFSKCSSLTSVTLGTSVTSIDKEAFNQCSSLTTVTIPSSVTSIGPSAFQSCSLLTGVYFKGNAPTVDTTAFNISNNVKVYYMPGTTGWPTPPPAPYGGRPTVLWNPQVLNDASFGVVANHFGFTITGTSGMIVVVEVSTDLITWTPLQTISFPPSGSFPFSDPALVSAQAARFYRPRMP